MNVNGELFKNAYTSRTTHCLILYKPATYKYILERTEKHSKRSCPSIAMKKFANVCNQTCQNCHGLLEIGVRIVDD